ncbi:MAG: addiction module toxin, HicA family [Treponema sp.]|nr:addiction module toxin, HicA family [Treponema sp.]
MKRNLLLKKLAEAGAVFVRPGAGHDLYRQPKTGRQESVPRHADINERLAKGIIKGLSGT